MSTPVLLTGAQGQILVALTPCVPAQEPWLLRPWAAGLSRMAPVYQSTVAAHVFDARCAHPVWQLDYLLHTYIAYTENGDQRHSTSAPYQALAARVRQAQLQVGRPRLYATCEFKDRTGPTPEHVLDAHAYFEWNQASMQAAGWRPQALASATCYLCGRQAWVHLHTPPNSAWLRAWGWLKAQLVWPAFYNRQGHLRF